MEPTTKVHLLESEDGQTNVETPQNLDVLETVDGSAMALGLVSLFGCRKRRRKSDGDGIRSHPVQHQRFMTTTTTTTTTTATEDDYPPLDRQPSCCGDEEECGICLERNAYPIVLCPCGHDRFCSTCVLKLVASRFPAGDVRCPLCRAQVSVVKSKRPGFVGPPNVLATRVLIALAGFYCGARHRLGSFLLNLYMRRWPVLLLGAAASARLLYQLRSYLKAIVIFLHKVNLAFTFAVILYTKFVEGRGGRV